MLRTGVSHLWKCRPGVAASPASKLPAKCLSSDSSSSETKDREERRATNENATSSSPASPISRIFGQRRPQAQQDSKDTSTRQADSQHARVPRSRQAPFRQPHERPRQWQPPRQPVGRQAYPQTRPGEPTREDEAGFEADDSPRLPRRDKNRLSRGRESADWRGQRGDARSPIRKPSPRSATANVSRPPRSRPPSRGEFNVESASEAAYRKDQQKFRLGPDEPMALLHPKTAERIRSSRDMPMLQSQVEMEVAHADQMRFDPTVNFNWRMPVRAPKVTPDQVADAMKEEWMAHLGLETEEHWQVVKEFCLEGVEDEIQSRDDFYGVRDAKADEEALESFKGKLAPSHPLYHHLEMSVHQLQRNPWWTFQQKEQYLTSLVSLAK